MPLRQLFVPFAELSYKLKEAHPYYALYRWWTSHSLAVDEHLMTQLNEAEEDFDKRVKQAGPLPVQMKRLVADYSRHFEAIRSEILKMGNTATRANHFHIEVENPDDDD